MRQFSNCNFVIKWIIFMWKMALCHFIYLSGGSVPFDRVKRPSLLFVLQKQKGSFKTWLLNNPKVIICMLRFYLVSFFEIGVNTNTDCPTDFEFKQLPTFCSLLFSHEKKKLLVVHYKLTIGVNVNSVVCPWVGAVICLNYTPPLTQWQLDGLQPSYNSQQDKVCKENEWINGFRSNRRCCLLLLHYRKKRRATGAFVQSRQAKGF